MYEYYVKKDCASIEYLRNYGVFDNKLFAAAGLEKGNTYLANKFNRCTFSKVSFKQVSVIDTEFNFTVFVKCYFKDSELTKVKFNNCEFIECSFNNVKICDCDFFYTEWEKTYIKYNDLRNSLPKECNHRRKMCKTMAFNCLQDNNVPEYKKFYFEWRKAQEQEYKDILLKKEDYYREEYKFKDFIRYFMKLLASKLSGLICGYGEKMVNILISAFILILVNALIYCTNYDLNIDNFLQALYISFSAFFCFNNSELSSMFYRWIFLLEYVMGLLFMGTIVAYIFRKINRRT